MCFLWVFVCVLYSKFAESDLHTLLLIKRTQRQSGVSVTPGGMEVGGWGGGGGGNCLRVCVCVYVCVCVCVHDLCLWDICLSFSLSSLSHVSKSFMLCRASPRAATGMLCVFSIVTMTKVQYACRGAVVYIRGNKPPSGWKPCWNTLSLAVALTLNVGTRRRSYASHLPNMILIPTLLGSHL